MTNRIEINVCADCLTVRESDDLSSFDYAYSEPEAATRIEECTAGWAALDAQGRVFIDNHEDDEFGWEPCDCCGSRFGGTRTRYALFPDAAESGNAGGSGPVVHK